MAGHANRDLYEVLGVPRDASAAAIRTAYLAAARAHHPDRHLDESAGERTAHEGSIREANAAYEVLGNRLARRRYDEQLKLSEDIRRNGWTSGSDAEARRRQRIVDDAAAKAAWRPFDDRPVEPDPRLVDDEVAPTPRETPPVSPLVVTRRVVGGFAVVFILLGLFTNIAQLGGAAIVLVVIFLGLFLVAPLLALGKSVSNDRR